MIAVTSPQRGLSALCEPVLCALPEWFGIEAATQQYIRDIEDQLTFVAYDHDETVAGFLTIVEHNEFAAEIHVMGVLPQFHRHGMGRALILATEDYLRENGFEFLQVKTLSSSHPDIYYERTRAFYLAMGFRPLQEFPDLWGSDNPCLQLVKAL